MYTYYTYIYIYIYIHICIYIYTFFEDSFFCLGDPAPKGEKTSESSPHRFRFVICGLDVVRKGG